MGEEYQRTILVPSGVFDREKDAGLLQQLNPNIQVIDFVPMVTMDFHAKIVVMPKVRSEGPALNNLLSIRFHFTPHN